ncbi:MAG: hypothetical protein MH204_09985 [Fimbriimonadaceae bacterium]|nr:hypothetical protein [Fimbriimonadaceae bacterium]
MIGALLSLSAGLQAPLERLSLSVGSVTRTAVVRRGPEANAPIVFVFHGKGGSGVSALRSTGMADAWPEALVIAPDGRPTVTPRDPDGLRTGWNGRRGGEDLPFFDALLAWAGKEGQGNLAKVAVMGHSNGGGFVYSLWRFRSDRIATFAPSAAQGAAGITTPKPAFLVMGRADTVVAYADQQTALARLLDLFSPTRRPEPTPEPLGSANLLRFGTSPEIVAYDHPGGHEYPQAATEPMVAFFRKVLGNPAPGPSLQAPSERVSRQANP